MKYFEELMIGDRRELGSYTFEADAIRRFATQFDPQPFHLSEEGGRNSLFGGLCASGWHIGSAFMQLLVADHKRQREALIARGEKPVAWGPSPGFTDLKWLKPVMAGDTLSYASELTSLRESASRPQWGIAQAYNTGINQRGGLAFSYISLAFVPRRGAAS